MIYTVQRSRTELHCNGSTLILAVLEHMDSAQCTVHTAAGQNCIAMRQHCVIVARRHSVIIHTLKLSFCSNTHSHNVILW